MQESSLKEVARMLKTTGVVALTAHINPDGDALGSILGLGMALEQMGKQVYMLIDDNVSEQYSFMPGVDKLIRPGENTRIAADILIVLDASDFERLGRVRDCVQAGCVINIDHHISNSGGADYRLLDVQAAATCEIVFSLLGAMEARLSPAIAGALYTGIVSDCGFFRYANTTANTLRIAASLLDTGISPSETADFLETQPVERLYLLPKILSSLEFYLAGRVACITIPCELYCDNMDSESLIRYPRYISGVEVAVLFKGMTADLTRVSLRSKTLDVSRLALEFGGGGHVRASGCTIKADIDTARDIIIQAITLHLEASDHADRDI